MSRVAAITGMGAVSALGTSCDAMWAAVEAGENGIRTVTRYPTAGLGSDLGGMVEDDAFPEPRSIFYAVHAGKEALAQARLDPATTRIGLVLGTSLGADLAMIGNAIGDLLGLVGPRIVISTACSSSTHAVGLARDLVFGGHCDAVLAGGTDELSPEIFAGFSALGVVCRERCAPFSQPVGTSLGEGAGLVLVEQRERASARGVPAIALVRGYALSSDAHHATSPDPNGAGVARALRGALDDAGLDPSAVAYVNAHGTGTAANDVAEFRAIVTTFGDKNLPLISSSKSFLGHAQGAAGILELIVTILGMTRGMVPHTMGFAGARPRCPEDPVAGDRPRPMSFTTALSTSSAFGGANATVAITSPVVSAAAERPCRPIYVVSTAVAESVTEKDFARLVRGVDPRGLDTTTKLLAVVTKRALDDAGIATRGSARSKLGLFVGQTRVSPAADAEFHGSIRERGLPKLNATAFAKMVLNAAAGAVTRMFDLRGASTAISTGDASGASIIALAADYLAWHDEVDTLVAVGVHERGLAESDGVEGAAAMVLTTRPPAGPAVRLERWSFSAAQEPKSSGLGAFSTAAQCVQAVAVASVEQRPIKLRFDRGTLSVELVFGRTE